MFEYTFAEFSQQSADQPVLMTIWLRWLVLVNIIPALIFVRQVQARWVLGAVAFIAVVNVPLGMMFGFGKALAIPHLIVWIPLIIYLAQEWRNGQIKNTPIFKGWIAAVMITNLISVIFDIRDGTQFLLGDTEPIKVSTSDIPYVTFAAIIVALAALFIYLRRPARNF